MNHLEEHIPASLHLERPHTRDDREEERALLRTADGRVIAVVDRIEPSGMVN